MSDIDRMLKIHHRYLLDQWEINEREEDEEEEEEEDWAGRWHLQIEM